MPAKFYDRVVDGKPVTYFRFDLPHGDVWDAPAAVGDKILHPQAWALYERELARASQPAAAEQKREDHAAPSADNKAEGGPESGPDDDTADPGEKILRQRERAAGRRPKK